MFYALIMIYSNLRFTNGYEILDYHMKFYGIMYDLFYGFTNMNYQGLWIDALSLRAPKICYEISRNVFCAYLVGYHTTHT